MSALRFAQADPKALPLHGVSTEELETWRVVAPDGWAAWMDSVGFKAQPGKCVLIPDGSGGIAGAVVGLGSERDRARGRFHFAAARAELPGGTYRLDHGPEGDALAELCLGWLLAGYRFDRYADAPAPSADLMAPEGIDPKRLEVIAAGEALTRDLINTPASDMGPDALAAACEDLAGRHGAACTIIEGDSLLEGNFPMIHAVGRAAARAPRLIDMRWGEDGPALVLVGKGVCFDTGGLNLKPGASMGLMKKDMGGAATVLGLAQMIMDCGLPLRLRVLIPAVENSVGGASFRPQDILTSRKGLTVEINNTDAEGRLVLADALALADEEPADLIISMATLTGAARVAVGPDIAPFYTNEDRLAERLAASAAKVRDPVWRMPFWDPYEPMIEPGIADLDNAPKGGFAGSITAALFLRRFVENARYMHFDIFGWQPNPAPARPKGGVGQGARAILDALPDLLK